MIIVPPTMGKVALSTLPVGTCCTDDSGNALLVLDTPPSAPPQVGVANLATGVYNGVDGSVQVTAYPNAAVLLGGAPPVPPPPASPAAAASSGRPPAPSNPRVGR